MTEVRVTFAGAGDAFGSGGRLQTCIHVAGSGPAVLLDCGATSLVGMKRLGIDPNEVGVVVLTHLHGDHFGGLPFLVLDGQFRRRELDLTVVGPTGTEERMLTAMEALYPGMTTVERRFSVRVVEAAGGAVVEVPPATVRTFPVVHASGSPALAVRVDYGGKSIAYSGDTEWTTQLKLVGDGADLFVCESYYWQKTVRYHLDWTTLNEHRSALGCDRLVLTHMSEDMLARVGDLPSDVTAAADGAAFLL